MLALSFFAFFCLSAFSQSSASLVELGNLSAVKWKSLSDFNQTVLQENARMDLALAPAGLQAPDRALYQAYKQLIAYIQSDVQAGKTVGEVFLKRYEQVLIEAPKHPTMHDLLTGTLEGMLPGLVEALQEVPVPVTSQ